MVPLETVLGTIFATFLGSFVQGLTSFGFSVISWAVYSVLAQFHVAMPEYHHFLVCLACFAGPTVTLSIFKSVLGRVRACLPSLGIAMILELPGNYTGIWFARVVPVSILRLGIGCLFIAMALPKITFKMLSLMEGFVNSDSGQSAPSKVHAQKASVMGKRTGFRHTATSEPVGEEDLDLERRRKQEQVAAPEAPSPLANGSDAPSPSATSQAACLDEAGSPSAAGLEEQGAACGDAGGQGILPGGWCVLLPSSCPTQGHFALGLALTAAASGFAHGAVGIPGPPWMLFFAFVGLDKGDCRTFFCCFSMVATANFEVTYTATGQVKRDLIPLYIAVVIASAIGTHLGSRWHSSISADTATISLFAMTLLSGVQALGFFDLTNGIGALLRLFFLCWLATLLTWGAWRRWSVLRRLRRPVS